MNSKSMPLTDTEAARIMREIVSAVAYIHNKGIIHRDLKATNILIDESTVHSDHQKVKLIDFGFSDKQKSSFDGYMGTP